jgi:hypothetical protein
MASSLSPLSPNMPPMANDEYTRIALEEDEKCDDPLKGPSRSWTSEIVPIISIVSFALFCFAIGFGVGQNWDGKLLSWPRPGEDELLKQQTFIPES